ncbi:tetratricopeptide repeat protein [bacterium]|nr:tetratricopeptide repeat protein [bacterium]RQV95995.1 MAG: outer membrane protein assembly factor BamD [bacterium]
MRQRVNFYIIVLLGVLIHASLNGQGFRLTQPAAIGGSFVATHLDGMPELTDAGPGLELFIKYNISPRIFIAPAVGVSTITDGTLTMENFRTTLLPTVELKAGINLMQGSNFLPFIYAGAHAFGSKTTVSAPPLPSFTTDTVYDGGAFVGGGIQYSFNEQWAFHIMGDYRYNFTETADPKSKFWVAKTGLTYSLQPRRTIPSREEIEYPLDENELSLDDLFREDTSGSGRSDEEEALALLFQTENESMSARTEETTYPNTEVGQLMKKIDDLKNEMDRRQNQIDDLENIVRAHEQALAEVTGRMAGEVATGSFGVLSAESFTANYEQGLQKFYDRQYNDAILIFKSLLTSNPDHRLASNCQYWIGESYNQLQQYTEAISAFRTVLQYQSSYKFDDALLMSGICYMKIGDRITARDNFQQLVSRFPDSEYAPMAMRYLGRL